MKKRRVSTKFRDRVKGLARLPGSRLVASPKNFRKHDDKQRSVLRGLLKEIGLAGAVLAWVPDDAARAALRTQPFEQWLETFSGQVQLVDGHMRREEVRAQSLPVLITDLDELEAQKALATFDAVSDMAGTDKATLISLLERVGEPEEDGTAALLEELEKLAGMHDDERDNAKDQTEEANVGYVVLVDCENEGHQLQIIEQLMELGLKCRALT